MKGPAGFIVVGVWRFKVVGWPAVRHIAWHLAQGSLEDAREADRLLRPLKGVCPSARVAHRPDRCVAEVDDLLAGEACFAEVDVPVKKVALAIFKLV